MFFIKGKGATLPFFWLTTSELGRAVMVDHNGKYYDAKE